MPIILNTPHTNTPERYRPGEPGYLRERYIAVAGRALCAELKNREAAQLCVDALWQWKTIDGVPLRFKSYLLYRAAFRSQLDHDGGRIRGLLERAVKALVGAKPQHLVDEAVELLASQLNNIAIEISAHLILEGAEPPQPWF